VKVKLEVTGSFPTAAIVDFEGTSCFPSRDLVFLN